MERHVLLEPNCVDQAVGTHFIGFSELRLRLHVLVKDEEPFVKGFRHLTRNDVRGVVGIERREGIGKRNGNPAGLSLGRGDEARGTHNCERGCGQSGFLKVRGHVVFLLAIFLMFFSASDSFDAVCRSSQR